MCSDNDMAMARRVSSAAELSETEAVSEEVDSALCTRTTCCTANGQNALVTLQDARIMRTGRRIIRQPVSATFIHGFQGAMNRRRVCISAQIRCWSRLLNSGPPSTYHSSTCPLGIQRLWSATKVKNAIVISSALVDLPK